VEQQRRKLKRRLALGIRSFERRIVLTLRPSFSIVCVQLVTGTFEQLRRNTTEELALVQVRDKAVSWHEGLTLRNVLQEIGFDIPGIFVLVDGRKVRREEWDTYRVRDNTRVDVHRIAAGG
jgi:thiamine biosynthesis protein ThiS